MWFIGVEVEQETSASPPKRNPGSAPVLLVILYSTTLIKLKTQVHPGEHSSNVEQLRQRRNRSVLHMSIAII